MRTLEWTVVVRFKSDASPSPDPIPDDGPLLRNFASSLKDQLTAEATRLQVAFSVRAVTWTHRGSFRVEFSHPPSPKLMEDIKPFFAQFINPREVDLVETHQFSFPELVTEIRCHPVKLVSR